MSRFANLPSVESLLQTAVAAGLSTRYGRPLTVDAIRLAVDDARGRLRAESDANIPAVEAILSQAEARLAGWTSQSLRPVINATGVILHTNLGRAPVSTATLAAMSAAAQGYSNLELDLATGKRGDRFVHAEAALQKLLGTQAALVVNNNASAVLLVLAALAARKGAIISRSQLVEIGGGFRMPDVMKQSGARLIEVGTTNKVRLTDYEERFSEAHLVMRAHRSNFKMIGFVEEPDFAALVKAAHNAGLVVVDDLGSGALLDTAKYGMAHEPTVQESLADGADVTCFSADKLLGGPQAGIIVGNAELVRRIRKHPLARAVRADKVCLAGISATLDHYLKDEAEREIPVWSMISMPLEDTRARAQRWADELGAGQVHESESTLGGGSLPGESVPTYVLSLGSKNTDAFMRSLRWQSPPIIARTEKDHVLLDPRTVRVWEDPSLLAGIRSALEDAA
jgi:L-seryl-tRNA(Ser) seleniumtransferase